MTQLFSRRQIVGGLALAMALVWGSGLIVSSLPQTARLRAHVQSTRVVDYATDVVVPGSPFSTRPTYDQ